MDVHFREAVDVSTYPNPMSRQVHLSGVVLAWTQPLSVVLFHEEWHALAKAHDSMMKFIVQQHTQEPLIILAPVHGIEIPPRQISPMQ